MCTSLQGLGPNQRCCPNSIHDWWTLHASYFLFSRKGGTVGAEDNFYQSWAQELMQLTQGNLFEKGRVIHPELYDFLRLIAWLFDSIFPNAK